MGVRGIPPILFSRNEHKLKLKSSLVKAQNSLTLRLIQFGLKKSTPVSLERLGSHYGGWYVPSDFANSSSYQKVLISAGIGQDVTFDIEMQKRNFYVVAIDPLKSSCNFAVNSELDQSKLRIVNAGLWVNSGQTIFHPPKIKTHNSWSITSSQKSSSVLGTKFNTITIAEILRFIPGDQDRQIVVLKMDIEGAERYLFESIIINHNSFDFIGIELDYIYLLPFTQIFKRLGLILETRKNIRNLEAVGLTLVHSDSFNFFWLNINLLRKIKK